MDNKEVCDISKVIAKLKGFWDRDLSVPAGGGVWGANRKRPLFDAVKSQLAPLFKLVQDPAQRQADEAASQFEASLQMALTEAAMFVETGILSACKPLSVQ